MTMFGLALASACDSTDHPIESGDSGVDASTTAGVAQIDLGDVNDGAAVVLMIPDHTIGFHVVIEVDGATGTEQVGIYSITSPSGEKVVDVFAPVGAMSPSAASSLGIAATSVPQTSATSAIPVSAGAWSLEFSVPGGGRPTRARTCGRPPMASSTAARSTCASTSRTA